MPEPRPVSQRDFGIGRGKVFPADHAKTLLNPARRIVQSPTRTVARMGLGPRDLVLELGCGPGYFTPALVAALAEGRVVAFDLQAEMLQLARTRVGPDATACVQGDAAWLPFAPSSFDGAVVILVLGEVPDRGRCIAELARVVRTGGRLVFCESRRDSDFIRIAELVALVEPCGFRLEGRQGPRFEYTASFLRS